MQQTIDTTDGAREYTFPVTITETNGKNISADTVQVAFGDSLTAGGGWFTPATISSPTTSSFVVQVLVGAVGDSAAEQQLAPGIYFLWWQLADVPEVVPRKSPLKLVVK